MLQWSVASNRLTVGKFFYPAFLFSYLIVNVTWWRSHGSQAWSQSSSGVLLSWYLLTNWSKWNVPQTYIQGIKIVMHISCVSRREHWEIKVNKKLLNRHQWLKTMNLLDTHLVKNWYWMSQNRFSIFSPERSLLDYA